MNSNRRDMNKKRKKSRVLMMITTSKIQAIKTARWGAENDKESICKKIAF